MVPTEWRWRLDALGPVLQVTGQRDGARLLVTLESKQAERLDAALQRFQGLLKPGAVIDVQRDVSSLSGQSGKTSSSSALSPEPRKGAGLSRGCGGSGVAGGDAAAGAAAVQSLAEAVPRQDELRRKSGVWQAASAAGLTEVANPGPSETM